MTSDEDKTITAKSVAMCVLFSASVTLGTLPVILSRIFKWNSDARNNVYVKSLLCFGGGVLLCTTFLHLLPEVTERINDLEYIPQYEIHYAELLMCIGFFVMYFVEECVHSYIHHRQKNAAVLVKSLSVRRGELQSDRNLSQVSDIRQDLQEPITICVEDNKNHNSHMHQQHGHSHFAADSEDSGIKSFRGLLVVLALSVHELFEGLAVGLESSSKNVWYMFGAVSAHKLVIAFCIGLELVTSGMKICLVLVYIFTFAFVSPLGIGIGIILTRTGESSADLLSIFLQGLASGTLLYVIFFEILNTERKSGLRQFFSVLLGFLLMLGLTLLE